MTLDRGFNSPVLQEGFSFLKDIPKVSLLLRDRFVEPPFSILDARSGNWQDRKRAWLTLNIQSELGRDAKSYSCNDDAVLKYSYLPNIDSGTSVFDPVLCELVYKWFCPQGGSILDPFAGGSVRGIVANYIGYEYTGIDLIEDQVIANREQAKQILPSNEPRWIIGDSANMDRLLGANDKFDFIFTCPPYYNLEKYSDIPTDLSCAASYGAFLKAYKTIIFKSINHLKLNRFACFVVGNIRDNSGFLYDLVGDTARAFAEANVRLYNEAILITPVGSLPIRTSAQFDKGRKLGKSHQNVLVFYKGDTKYIKEIVNGNRQ